MIPWYPPVLFRKHRRGMSRTRRPAARLLSTDCGGHFFGAPDVLHHPSNGGKLWLRPGLPRTRETFGWAHGPQLWSKNKGDHGRACALLDYISLHASLLGGMAWVSPHNDGASCKLCYILTSPWPRKLFRGRRRRRWRCEWLDYLGLCSRKHTLR